MVDIFGGRTPILKVAKIGDPILRQLAEPLTDEDIADVATQKLIDSMIATMREMNGAGLAAPQVSVSRQILVIEKQENSRYQDDEEDIPLTILINPKIVDYSNELEEGWEGCLSATDLWGKVKRPKSVVVEAKRRDGTDVRIETEGFFAVVLQHEIDHLYGKVFIDRMEDMSTLSFTAEYNKYGD